MPLHEYVLSAYRFNLSYCKLAVEDVPDDQMCAQPVPRINHAAWILGHLSLERLFLSESLAINVPPPPGFVDLFMFGSTPSTDRSKYPSKEVLLAELEKSHALVEAAFSRVDEAFLQKPTPSERIAKIFPKLGDLVIGMMTTHAGMHVGQLSAWRRAMGLPHVFK